MLKRLDKAQLRLLIEGLRLADGHSAITAEQTARGVTEGEDMGRHRICTSSLSFRDELVMAALHAGYSPHYHLSRKVGLQEWWREPATREFFSTAEKDDLLEADGTRVFVQMNNSAHNWWLRYNEVAEPMMASRDVLYDGKAAAVGSQRRTYGAGFVALRNGEEVDTGKPMANNAIVYSEVELDKIKAKAAASSASSSSAAASSSSSSGQALAYVAARDGRAWCVEVEHGDHLIIAQRAFRGAGGVVTKASRPVVVGNCFFGKQRYVAAIACLKRALYLDPFEWIISYNLGLVHLNTGQYASAFHYLSSSINLKPDFPSSYMYLAICLSRLDDIDNAIAAYEKAVGMEKDHLFHLNFAITAWQGGRKEKAREQWNVFLGVWNDMGEEMRGADNEVVEMMVEMERTMAVDEGKKGGGVVAGGAAGAEGAAKKKKAKEKPTAG